MSKTAKLGVLAAAALAASVSHASVFTSTSPSGLDVTTVGASTVGGIVVHFIGNNGNQVVSQLAASSLYQGFAPSNPFSIGTQAGWTDAVTGALGGGITRAMFRFSLEDGDSAAGNFDFNENFLQVNGVEVANWSSVNAENTTQTGGSTSSGFSGGGFRDSTLDTGWFDITNAAQLAAIFAAIDSSDGLAFSLRDIDPGDNFFDFTLGIDKSLINVGTGPVVTPPTNPPGGTVPEPTGLALAGLALAGVFAARKRKQQA